MDNIKNQKMGKEPTYQLQTVLDKSLCLKEDCPEGSLWLSNICTLYAAKNSSKLSIPLWSNSIQAIKTLYSTVVFDDFIAVLDSRQYKVRGSDLVILSQMQEQWLS